MHEFHPKTLFEIAMALLTISVSFPSKSRFFATFSILLTFGESWNPTNCEKFNADGSLMGRTNLDKSSGKNKVRNCDLLQSDFCCSVWDRPREAKGFLGVCSDTWKKMRHRNVVIFYA